MPLCTVYAQNAHYAYLKKLEVMSKNGFQIRIQLPQIRQKRVFLVLASISL